MRLPTAAFALGLCLLSSACADSTDPIAAAPAAPDSSTATPEPGPDPATTATRATPAVSATPSARSTAPSPSPKRTPAKPTAAQYDAEAACDAAQKAEDALFKVKEKNGPSAVGHDASPARVAAAVAALQKGYRANAQTAGHIRDRTADSAIEAALTGLITARRAVANRLASAGTDVQKKNAALNTLGEFDATKKLWTYPDGVCLIG